MIKLMMSALLLLGCTDADWDKFAVLGDKAEVKCYSGERLIFHGISTGKISNETNSDGYFARWNVITAEGQWGHIDTSEPVAGSVSGNCVMLYVD